MVCETCLWYYWFGRFASFRKSDKSDEILSSAPKNTPILPIFVGWVWKIVNFVPQSFNAKTDQLSFLFVLVCETWPWFTGLLMVCHFPKVTKRTGFCQRRPNTPILPIFSGQMWNNVNIFPQSFNAKTDQLSFLFIMIHETWAWYYWFGCGA